MSTAIAAKTPSVRIRRATSRLTWGWLLCLEHGFRAHSTMFKLRDNLRLKLSTETRSSTRGKTTLTSGMAGGRAGRRSGDRRHHGRRRDGPNHNFNKNTSHVVAAVFIIAQLRRQSSILRC